MVAETIKALRENKLDKVVILISQMTFEQLIALAISYMKDEYVTMSEAGIIDAEIEHHFDLPRAYRLSFYLYEDDGDYIISLYFTTDKPGQMYDEEDDTLYVFKGKRIYSINMMKRQNKGEWTCFNMPRHKKRLFHLIKEFV